MDARTAFEKERDKLVAEISESLGRLLTNVNALNRNIEAANLVGKQFDHPHTLWSKFEAVMRLPGSSEVAAASTTDAAGPGAAGTAAGAGAGATKDILSASGPLAAAAGAQAEDETVKLPPGVAPGGGKSSWGEGTVGR